VREVTLPVPIHPTKEVPELVAGEVALPSKNDIVGRS
jgi:hypothetical protein